MSPWTKLVFIIQKADHRKASIDGNRIKIYKKQDFYQNKDSPDLKIKKTN